MILRMADPELYVRRGSGIRQLQNNIGGHEGGTHFMHLQG